MGLLPIPAPKLTQGASRAGFWRAAALVGASVEHPISNIKVHGECNRGLEK